MQCDVDVHIDYAGVVRADGHSQGGGIQRTEADTLVEDTAADGEERGDPEVEPASHIESNTAGQQPVSAGVAIVPGSSQEPPRRSI